MIPKDKTITATIQFTACGKYDPQFTTLVLRPAISMTQFDPAKGWLHNLTAGHRSPDLQTVDIPDGWDADRFRFKMVVVFDHGGLSHEICVVYGHTGQATDLSDDTKLYITRIASFRKSKYIVQGGVEQSVVSGRYDHLMIPGNVQEDRMFLCTTPGVLNHLCAEQAFATHFRPDFETFNSTSEHRKGGVKAVSIDELSAEVWAERAERACKSAYRNPLERESLDEIYSHAADVCGHEVFDITQLGEVLRWSTSYGYSDHITYKELMDLCTPESTVSVDYTKTAAVSTPNPSLRAQMIFDDFTKKAVVEASKNGNEKLHKEWTDNGIDVSESTLSTTPVFSDLTWMVPEEDESDYFTNDLEGFFAVSKQTPVPPPMPNSPVSYGVDEYRVNIDLDLNGDIVGVVTINGGEEYRFVKPAYSLAAGTGLSVSQTAMKDAGWIISQLFHIHQ